MLPCRHSVIEKGYEKGKRRDENMTNLTCHICKFEQLIDTLATAERHGWSRSAGGWLCESYDCYNLCDHQRLSLHDETADQASEAEA